MITKDELHEVMSALLLYDRQVRGAIHGECITHDDEGSWTQEWPTEFAALPRIGDVVESKKGIRRQVLQVTHLASFSPQGGPKIEVLLGKGWHDKADSRRYG